MRFSTAIALFGLAVIASSVIAGPADAENGMASLEDDDMENVGLLEGPLIGKRDFQQTKEKSGMIGLPIIFGAKGQKTWLQRPAFYLHRYRYFYTPYPTELSSTTLRYRYTMRFSTTLALVALAAFVSHANAAPSPATGAEAEAQMDDGEPGVIDFGDSDGLFKRDFQQTKEKWGWFGIPIVFHFGSKRTWLDSNSGYDHHYY
ncbi:hypothetical protein H4R33_003086 [Dimargaris cristalligena]|nr:hypothetical protein H4R33_003086 [Dimargaris cristalligena]